MEIKGSVFKKFEKNNLFQMSNSGELSSALLKMQYIISTILEKYWSKNT